MLDEDCVLNVIDAVNANNSCKFLDQQKQDINTYVFFCNQHSRRSVAYTLEVSLCSVMRFLLPL